MSCWNAQVSVTQQSQLLFYFIFLGEAKYFRKSCFLIILSHLCHIVMLPPPCFTTGSMCWGLKVSFWLIWTYFLSHVMLNLNPRRHLARSYGHLQISAHQEGFVFGAGPSFFVCTISVQGDVKLVSQWTETLVPAVSTSWYELPNPFPFNWQEQMSSCCETKKIQTAANHDQSLRL